MRSVANGDADARLAAFDRFAAAPPPTPHEEIWRYSRIAELDLDRFAYGTLITTISGAGAVLVDDGAVDQSLFDEQGELDLFADLNRALMSAIHLRVKPGAVIEQPIVINHELTSDGTACFPRLVIEAGEDSEITVIERFTSSDSVTGIIVPVLRVHAARSARVKYLSVNDLGSHVWQIANQQSTGERDSNTLLSTVALGGDYARVRTHASPARAAAPDRSRCTSPMARRPTTSAPRRSTLLRRPPVICCSRAQSTTLPAVSTPA